ncbi:MAG: glycosyltransferase, partial [Phascolarctobacterium sp.]|nr:glycosyltransferase [Phascolarctobacterium sp.]
KNTTLYKKLLSKFGDSVQILKYTEQIPQLMCGADMIISKAGGLSSAEVLASDLDFIIYKPLPGQEENNAKFLAANCGATIASDTKAITQKVKELCKLEENIAKERAYYGKPQAAEKISNYILGRLSKI